MQGPHRVSRDAKVSFSGGAVQGFYRFCTHEFRGFKGDSTGIQGGFRHRSGDSGFLTSLRPTRERGFSATSDSLYNIKRGKRGHHRSASSKSEPLSRARSLKLYFLSFVLSETQVREIAMSRDGAVSLELYFLRSVSKTLLPQV